MSLRSLAGRGRQARVLGAGLGERTEVQIGAAPSRKELLVLPAAGGEVAAARVGPRKPEVSQGNDGGERVHASMVEDAFELLCRLRARSLAQQRFSSQVYRHQSGDRAQ